MQGAGCSSVCIGDQRPLFSHPVSQGWLPFAAQASGGRRRGNGREADAMRPPRIPPQPQPVARSAAWPVGLLVALCFTTLPLFLALSPGRPTLFDLWQQMGIRVTLHYDDETKPKPSSEPSDSPSPESPRDVLLGGLLSPDIAESTCRSRYLSSLYRPPSPHSPSPYLVSRLRKYEALHRRCGPGTPLYDKSVRQLASAHHSMGLAECRYLVWTPPPPPGAGGNHHNNLGDRVLSMTSAFLYALLTRRVFLVDMPKDMAGLFCEPFPGASSWELPVAGFPVKNLTRLRRGSEHSYGNLIGEKKVGGEEPAAVRAELLPAYAYLHLAHDYQLPDHRFFCDGDQTVLGKVNWLLLRSDLYFAPGLFLVPQFEDELRWMFPAPDTAFHHVGRYLFHPSNKVWKVIAGYHASYMARFDDRIGIQIATPTTTLAAGNGSPAAPGLPAAEAYFEQVTACVRQQNILPEVDPDAASTDYDAAAASKAVLVSAARPELAERLRSVYYEHATVNGESVTVLPQPGAAGKQPGNQKVLVEMFLLSYCNVSVASGWSTVGYVGNGLAGVKPWLLPPPPRNQTSASPHCVRATSMEPCFHAPPSYDCRAKKSGDLGAVLRYVRRCEAVDGGLKLFD